MVIILSKNFLPISLLSPSSSSSSFFIFIFCSFIEFLFFLFKKLLSHLYYCAWCPIGLWDLIFLQSFLSVFFRLNNCCCSLFTFTNSFFFYLISPFTFLVNFYFYYCLFYLQNFYLVLLKYFLSIYWDSLFLDYCHIFL